MLTPMQLRAQAAPHPNSSSFAGMLAALASSANNGPTWSNEALEDDVVTLSYERALKAHARYKPANPGDRPLTAASDVEAQPAIAAELLAGAKLDEAAQARVRTQAAVKCDRRAASVTIRLSEAECARLRQRAAEAELTVSAYLRSCVLEADALRAQVKQALAEMRTAESTERPAAKTRAQRSWFGWLKRLFSRRGLKSC